MNTTITLAERGVTGRLDHCVGRYKPLGVADTGMSTSPVPMFSVKQTGAVESLQAVQRPPVCDQQSDALRKAMADMELEETKLKNDLYQTQVDLRNRTLDLQRERTKRTKMEVSVCVSVCVCVKVEGG